MVVIKILANNYIIITAMQKPMKPISAAKAAQKTPAIPQMRVAIGLTQGAFLLANTLIDFMPRINDTIVRGVAITVITKNAVASTVPIISPMYAKI